MGVGVLGSFGTHLNGGASIGKQREKRIKPTGTCRSKLWKPLVRGKNGDLRPLGESSR